MPLPPHVLARLSGATVAVALRRNPRARRYSLRLAMRTGEPVVTVPARGTLREAEAFIGRHVGWLEARLSERPAPRPFVDGALVPIRGVPHRIRRLDGRGLPSLAIEEGAGVLRVPGAPEHLARRVRDHLVRLARADLSAAVARHAATLGVRPSAVRLKDTVGRWGSASTSGALSFSWRLVMAPGPVLDYLAAHEVAHLREMNHGARFWAHVATLTPDMDRSRLWLKTHGAELHSYG